MYQARSRSPFLKLFLLFFCGGLVVAGWALYTAGEDAARSVSATVEPSLQTWGSHLKRFSYAAIKPHQKAPTYRFSRSCPLHYGFVFEQGMNASFHGRTSTGRSFPKGSKAVVRVSGVFELRAVPKQKDWLKLKLLWVKGSDRGVTVAKSLPSPSSGLVAIFKNDKEVDLRSTGRELVLRGTPKLLWEGKRGAFQLSHFWPELPKSPKGHNKKVNQRDGVGQIKAHSKTDHWLRIRGEDAMVMSESMQMKSKMLRLTHHSQYVFLTRGQLLFARFEHDNIVRYGGRRPSSATTSVIAELRLIKACHKLVLPPFAISKQPKRRFHLLQWLDKVTGASPAPPPKGSPSHARAHTQSR